MLKRQHCLNLKRFSHVWTVPSLVGFRNFSQRRTLSSIINVKWGCILIAVFLSTSLTYDHSRSLSSNHISNEWYINIIIIIIFFHKPLVVVGCRSSIKIANCRNLSSSRSARTPTIAPPWNTKTRKTHTRILDKMA